MVLRLLASRLWCSARNLSDSLMDCIIVQPICFCLHVLSKLDKPRLKAQVLPKELLLVQPSDALVLRVQVQVLHQSFYGSHHCSLVQTNRETNLVFSFNSQGLEDPLHSDSPLYDIL